MSHRLLQYLIFASAFCLAGCLPYISPSLEVVPQINLAEEADEVHAFRVDGTQTQKLGDIQDSTVAYSLSRISILNRAVLSQTRASLDRGMFVIGIALNYHIRYHQGCHVRLYRPGYELVEFRSWQFGKQLVWTPTNSLEAEEKAIDDIIADYEPEGIVASFRAKQGGLPWALCKGSHSKAHKEVLLFVATEYERLAEKYNRGKSSLAMVRRLEEKAQMVRGLASQ